MAQITNNQKLKHLALRELAEAREEISAEVDRVRQQLSPARVLQRVVDHHAGLLAVLAVAAGAIPALLIFRRKPLPVMVSVAKSLPKPVFGALPLGALGLLARSVTPVLMNSVIMLQVHGFIARKQPGPDAGHRHD